MPSQERGRRKRIPYRRIIGAPADGVTLDVVREVVQEGVDEFTFIGAPDTPAAYTGKARFLATVNDAEDGIEFGYDIEPIDQYLAAWDGSTLSGIDPTTLPYFDGTGTVGAVPKFTGTGTLGDSRITTDAAAYSAEVAIPAADADTQTGTLYVGSPETWNDKVAIAGESYSNAGVTGGSETGPGMKGESAASHGGDFSSEAAQVAALRGTNPNGPSALFPQGMLYPAARAINGNLTLTGVHHVVEASTTTAAVTLTLPTRAAWNDGIVYHIFDVGNNAATVGRAITVNRSGADTFLDGATSKTLATNRGHWQIVGSTNTAGTRVWYIERTGSFGV